MSRFVRRAWGWYLVLLDFEEFKVKLLRFRKDGALSVQKHKYRSELWLFLKGGGRVVTDSAAINKQPGSAIVAGQHKNIVCKQWHTFKAVATTYILEIQYGEMCVESDIERL